MCDKIHQEELSKCHRMLNHIRMRLVDKGIREGDHIITEVEDEFATGVPPSGQTQTTELNSSDMSPTSLFNQS